jgi:hypothetical protein
MKDFCSAGKVVRIRRGDATNRRKLFHHLSRIEESKPVAATAVRWGTRPPLTLVEYEFQNFRLIEPM